MSATAAEGPRRISSVRRKEERYALENSEFFLALQPHIRPRRCPFGTGTAAGEWGAERSMP